MKRVLVIILVFGLSQLLFSQEEAATCPVKPVKEEIRLDRSFVQKKSFDAQRIQEYKDSGDFTYEIPKKEASFFEKVWLWIKRGLLSILKFFLDDITPVVGFLAFLLRLLLWLLLAAALFLILKYFLNISTRGIIKGKNEAMIEFSDDEELIKNQDLEALLETALREKEFRLAVRFSYLMVLKRLTALELIQWQQEKTNEDYIKELNGKKCQPEFIKSTRLYDFVWYGNFEIREEEFSKANLLFTKLIKENLG